MHRKSLIPLLITLALLLPTLALAASSPISLTLELPAQHWSAAASPDTTADYITQVMYGQPGTVGKAPRLVGSRLTGKEAALYRALWPWIAQVAAGEVVHTEIGLDFADVLPQVSFTAAELGVDAILDGESLTAEAAAAIRAQLAVGLDVLMDALLADCPAELYWFDKTSGEQLGSKVGLSVLGDAVTLSGQYILTFSVVEACRLDGDINRMDGSFAQNLFTARDNAQAIVSKASGGSDLQMLRAYKDAICSLVSYNFEAAAGGVAYGDPWQLLWVFDGDDATNVVCEGYAKAFQYLCDLSVFQQDITAISVSGTMEGENHMWNLVTMPDGLNYLVDVTNCDSLATDELFLAGYTQADAAQGLYVYSVGSRGIRYVYGDRTLALYSAAELTVADAFYRLPADFILPAAVTVVEAEAFRGADFTALRLPEGVLRLESLAFADCASLQQVELPASLVDIAADAFDGCPEGLILFAPEGSAAAAWAEEMGAKVCTR